MSRSYKKFPYCGDTSLVKYGKIYSNRRVRRFLKKGDTISAGKGYKKFYDSWNIRDYKFICSLDEYLVRWGQYGSTEELINDWKKYYKRK